VHAEHDETRLTALQPPVPVLQVKLPRSRGSLLVNRKGGAATTLQHRFPASLGLSRAHSGPCDVASTTCNPRHDSLTCVRGCLRGLWRQGR